MKYRQQIKRRCVMMMHSMHRAAASGTEWLARLRGSILCRVVVVSRECRGASIDYFPSILILPPLEEIIA